MNYLKTFLPYLFGNKKGKSLDILLPDPIPWTKLNFEETLMFHTLKNSRQLTKMCRKFMVYCMSWS